MNNPPFDKLRTSNPTSAIETCPATTCRTCRRLFHVAGAPDYTRASWRRNMTISEGCHGPTDDLDETHYCTLHRRTGHESIPGTADRRSA